MNAVHIIDTVQHTLNMLRDGENTGVMVERDVLTKINEEFQRVINQKAVLAKCVKDFQTKMQGEIDDIEMPNLYALLSGTFTMSAPSASFVCTKCDKAFKNKHAISAHLRGKECGNGV